MAPAKANPYTHNGSAPLVKDHLEAPKKSSLSRRLQELFMARSGLNISGELSQSAVPQCSREFRIGIIFIDQGCYS